MKRVILAFVILLSIAGLYSAWSIFGPAVSSPEEKFFYIKTGAGFQDVRKNLLDKKIITKAGWFDRTAELLKFRTVKAGKYLITDNSSLFQLIRQLKNGRQTPVNLVITKIRTRKELASRLGRLFEFDSLDAIRFFSSNDTLSRYGFDTNTVMASVLPDTYTYFWNSTPRKVFQKLHDEYLKFWNKERNSQLDSMGLTAIQVITLASIIDEESNYLPEKDTIASVYLNRLRLKMPLQADPTVKFALQDFGLRRIYQKHLMVESPFNTYRNTGLPPGPICTPQLKTIDAVLNAPKTDYLYFVAKSDFSGAHVFAASYRDHLLFAKDYQQALNRQDSLKKTRQ